MGKLSHKVNTNLLGLVPDEAPNPFGVVDFVPETFEVLQVNDQLWELVGGDKLALAHRERIMKNVISMVPLVDRADFKLNLARAELGDNPVVFDTHLWHAEGYLVEVAGWASLVQNGKGSKYHLVLADVTRSRSRSRESRRALRIQHFLTLYDILFLLDTREQSALCYKFVGESPFDTTGSMRILLSDCLDYLVQKLSGAEQTEEVQKSAQDLEEFFEPLRQRLPLEEDVPQTARLRDVSDHSSSRIVFMSHGGILAQEGFEAVPCEAVLLDAEADAFFFGCRKLEDPFTGHLLGASCSGELMHALSPESGMAIFAVEGGQAYITFANERGRLLFGGAPITGAPLPLSSIIDALPIDANGVNMLRERKECVICQVPCGCTFTNWHIVVLRESETATRYTVVAYEIHPRDISSIGVGQSHLPKSSLDFDESPIASLAGGTLREVPSPDDFATAQSDRPDVFIRTFGYFDVFADGNAVVFSSAKSKELLALLVDRRGGMVTASEAVSCLWEDEAATPTVLSRQRKIAMRMKNTLDEYGIGHIVNAENGKRRLDVDAVRCDLYDYLAGDPKTTFSGMYLQNYSWGEVTLGELLTTMPFHE